MAEYTVGYSDSPLIKKTINTKENMPTASGLLPAPMEAAATSTATVLLSPNECATKAKNLLKEYFIGGDTDDAVWTVHE
jgi:muramoyltetrapeptide carboxypeptidase LdcA involved in peptidoglycan recycling